jgi:hypothetical protein
MAREREGGRLVLLQNTLSPSHSIRLGHKMARALYEGKRHTITEICHTLQISKTNLYRYLAAKPSTN